jgi:hypothetical protein
VKLSTNFKIRLSRQWWQELGASRDKERLEQLISLSPSSPRSLINRLATHVRDHYLLIVGATSLPLRYIKFQQASNKFTPTPQIHPIPTSDQGEKQP